MAIAEVIRSHYIDTYLQENNIWFFQGLCPIQSQVFGHQRTVRHRFLVMEWALVPFTGSPVSFVALLHQCTIQAGHHCRSKYLELCLCLSLSSGSLQSTFLYHEHYQSTGLKTLVRQQSDISIFYGMCKYCLQQQCVTISLWREANSLENQEIA